MDGKLTGKRLGEFRNFGPLLKKWSALMEDDLWGKDDAPWWYNERASVSLLAGAVWQTDGWAFEEFAAKKGRTRSRRQGRGDLLFTVKGKTYLGEAKQVWPLIGPSAYDPFPQILKSLKAACKDARDMDFEGDDEADDRIGIVFVAPRFRCFERKELDGQVTDFLDAIGQEENGILKGCAVAWAFRPEELIPKDKKSGCYYPGVVMLIHRAGTK